MSKTMSLRLADQQLALLEKLRRHLNQRSIGATLQLLLSEKLREEEYPYISFRDSAVGRQAYLAGTGLAVWEIIMVARAYNYDVPGTAEHLGLSETLTLGAMNYARAFQKEIDAELAENDAMDHEALKRLLPDIQLTVVPADLDIGEPTEQAIQRVLRLLLDGHVSPKVAFQLTAHRPTCFVASVRDWRNGDYRTASDDAILLAAYSEGLTLVTYDLRTIPVLLRSWGAARKLHAGVVFVDVRTIRPDDIGGLVRSLIHLWDTRAGEDWTNVVDHLQRAPA